MAPPESLSPDRLYAPRSHRRDVSYIDKSRTFYAAHGYEHPYRWATHADVPWAPAVNVSTARVAVVTTAFPVVDSGERQPKAAYAASSSPVPSAMFTSDLSWDKEATHTDDVGSFLPLDALRSLAADGEIGELGPRFYGVPTEYSQRRTREDAGQILGWCVEDEIDLVLLVPL